MIRKPPGSGGKRLTVEEYLAQWPAKTRASLQRLRRQIRSIVPDATEGISYGLLMFKRTRNLVAIGGAANHCALYLMSKQVVRDHAAELDGYDLGEGTIRFPIGGSLPDALVRSLVKSRIAEIGDR